MDCAETWIVACMYFSESLTAPQTLTASVDGADLMCQLVNSFFLNHYVTENVGRGGGGLNLIDHT